MRCLQCGKELALFKRLTGGEFCSEEHRQAYQRDYSQMALSRLLQSKSRTEKEVSEETGAVIERRTGPRAERRTGELVPVSAAQERPRIAVTSNTQGESPFDSGLDQNLAGPPGSRQPSDRTELWSAPGRQETVRPEHDSDATGYKATESYSGSSSRPSYSDERLSSATQRSYTRQPSGRASEFEKDPAAVLHFQIELPNATRPDSLPIPAPEGPEWTQAPALSNSIDGFQLSRKPLDGPSGSGRVDVPVLIHRPSRLLQSGADLDAIDYARGVRLTDRAASVASGGGLAPVTHFVEIPARSYPAGQGVIWHSNERLPRAWDSIQLGDLTRLQFPTAEVDDAEFSNLVTKTTPEPAARVHIPETAPTTEEALTSEAVTTSAVAIPIDGPVATAHPLPVPSPLSGIASPFVPAHTELEPESGWPSTTDLAVPQQPVLHEITRQAIGSERDHAQMSPEPVVSLATPGPIVPALSEIDVEADQNACSTDLLRASFENAVLENPVVDRAPEFHDAADLVSKPLLGRVTEPPLTKAKPELIPVAEISGLEVNPENPVSLVLQPKPGIEPLVESGNVPTGSPTALSEFQQEVAAVLANRWPAHDITEPSQSSFDSANSSSSSAPTHVQAQVTVPVVSEVQQLAKTLAAAERSLANSTARKMATSLATPSPAAQPLTATLVETKPVETPPRMTPKSTMAGKARFTVRGQRGQSVASRQRIPLPSSNPQDQQVQPPDQPKLELNVKRSTPERDFPASETLAANEPLEDLALPRKMPLTQTMQALELYEPQRLSFFARIKALLGYPV